MTKILLLSDTHSHIDERMLHYAGQADEIWHAGDFGSMKVIEKLEELRALKGAYGNIDGTEIRSIFPEVSFFSCEQVKVLIIHIGGYPGKYSPLARQKIKELKPDLFISGHSHILKAQYDKTNSLLHLNPGAAGKSGFHKVRTMMRFNINGKEITDLEIIELGPKFETKTEG